jgi:hypothetical protein
MSLIQVGLVDTTGTVNADALHAAAAAFNVQVQRDLPQFWNVQATVRLLPNPKKTPVGVWPVRIVNNLPPGEGGIHLDKHNQPYALVEVTPGSSEWTVAASHEIVEMLVDPYGNRLQASRSIQIVGGKIQDGPGEFEYLVEAGDPCEADAYAYSIQGVAVSDFITPHFYDPMVTPGTRYSFTGAVKAPRQILPGGYISWANPEEGLWQQLQYFDPNAPPRIVDLGPATGAPSMRAWVDSLTYAEVKKHRKPNPELMESCKTRRAHMEAAAEVRTKAFVM